MPEIYGEYEGDADSQFVGCIECSDLVDLFEPHPMYREEGVSELGEVVAQTYHFCSDSCLRAWRKRQDIDE